MGGVTGKQHHHIKDAANLGDIGYSGMGCTQRAVTETTADPHHLNVGMVVCHIHLYLFQAAGGEKTGGTADKHIFSGQGQACGDRDSVLFSDAHLHKLLRKFLGKSLQSNGATSIGGNSIELGIDGGQLTKGIGKGAAAGTFC